MSVLQVDSGCTPSIKHIEASAVYKDVIFSEQNKRKRCTEHIRTQKKRNMAMIRSHDGLRYISRIQCHILIGLL